MNRCAWLGLVVFALGGACSDAADPPTTTTITGRVTDETGAPLEAAEVSSVPTTQTVLTDADGRFRLEGVRFTVNYVVSAEKEGFRARTQTITPTAQGPNEVSLALPVQVVCTPQTRRCATGGGDEGFQVCNATGTYDPVVACLPDEACDPDDGLCKRSYDLTLTVSPSGVVRSEPTGLNCGTDCEHSFADGTTVTLTAISLARGEFLGWGGDCASAGSATECAVTMDAAKAVSADFTASEFQVSVRAVGNGDGRITSMPAGIDCTSDCRAYFDRGSTVTLTAVASPGFEFETWQRDCAPAGSNPSCPLTVDSAKDARARFRVPTYALTVELSGTGAGQVTSEPEGIDCPGSCQDDLPQGAQVTLTASAQSESTFAGWVGAACSTTEATCTFTLDGDTTVGAQFDGVTYPLMITIDGAGGGQVVSAPAGVDCPGTCEGRFAPDTMVTLTATPDGTSGFTGWGADCASSVATTCDLMMSEARSVGATFDPFYLFPLAADADCVAGLSFDGVDPLQDRCGTATPSLTGVYRRDTSRTSALGEAYVPDDASPTGGLDTGITLSGSPAATIEMTVRRDGAAFDGSGRAILLSDVDASAPAGGVRLLALDDGALAIQTWDQGRVVGTATAAGALTVGQWVHVAATIGPAGLGLFVDAQRVVAPAGAVSWTASSSTAWVGAERDGGVSGSRHRLNGAFDEVRLSGSVRY